LRHGCEGDPEVATLLFKAGNTVEPEWLADKRIPWDARPLLAINIATEGEIGSAQVPISPQKSDWRVNSCRRGE
jgi:hypothetical protein